MSRDPIGSNNVLKVWIDKDVCRTAPAIPGLLSKGKNIQTKFDFRQNVFLQCLNTS